jgi:imidazole glycerol-phosphate synthase subunit HisH
VPPKIIIIDYGAGNLRSVARAVAHSGQEPRVTSDPRDVASADAVIMPGVGAAADTMRNLREHGMVEPVRDYIASGRPFFGVCMGQQALLSVSEEGGEHECLGIIPGRVKKLPSNNGTPSASEANGNGARLKIPQMGWNRVRQKAEHPIFDGIADDSYFYFLHSYYPQPDDDGVVIGETEYGVTFASVLARDNIVATQFHPEKSSDAGLRMYANFLRIAAA